MTDPATRLKDRLPGEILPLILKLSAECARFSLDLNTVQIQRHAAPVKLIEVIDVHAPCGTVKVEVGL